MKWFRFYDDSLNDVKVQTLPGELYKCWVNILCIASKSDRRGVLPPVHAIAFALRMDEEEAGKVLNELIARELIDCIEEGVFAPHGWDKRQYASDNSTARAQKHRQKECNVSRNVAATPPEAETESETESDCVSAQESANPILEAVLDVTGESLNFQMGSLSAIKKQDIYKCVGIVEREGDCARDVQEWGRVLFPKSRNKSPADCNPPTVTQFLDEYQKVKRRFAKQEQPKSVVSYEDFITGNYKSRDISHDLAKEYTARYAAEKEKT